MPTLPGLALLPLLAAPSAPALPPGLEPGKVVVHELDVPVRVVLVGFDEKAVDERVLVRSLPKASRPVARYPRFHGRGRELGLEYRFRYDVVRKGKRFADALFAHLKRIGTREGRTLYQTLYNEQRGNVLDVPPTVLHVDGPAVEKWLGEHDADPNGGRGYTLYFLNWFGRDDFEFHVYTKTDEPDPDTRYNFGRERDSRKMVAWGGTHGRRWFYDFSAGPEAWGGSYDVDEADLDGDEEPDYRIPPIWEYRSDAYRRPELLVTDMGRLARFVGIDLLFTPSPLYDPLATAPRAGGAKVAHVARFEGERGASGGRIFDADFAREQWRRLQPYYRWRTGGSRHVIEGETRLALDIFVGNVVDDQACWRPFGDPFAQLFCHFTRRLSEFVPAYGADDHVQALLAFNTNDPGLAGLLGFADDDWATGAPSHVFMFDGADAREAGFGFTATGVHEVGHHLGLSHPHDGYDSEMKIDFAAAGALFFAWAGDESHTVMHDIALSNGFGAFDRDNMYRWEAAGHLNRANALAGAVVARADAERVGDLVRAADALARRSRAALRSWDYLRAVESARRARDLLDEAAERVGAVVAEAPVPPDPVASRTRPRTCRARYLHE
ncbi:MAG TPA: hypothetical protein VIC87_15510 [Vicinamibacteria bacterium]